MTLEEEIEFEVFRWMENEYGCGDPIPGSSITIFEPSSLEHMQWNAEVIMSVIKDQSFGGANVVLNERLMSLVKQVASRYTQVERLTSPYSLVRAIDREITNGRHN